VPSGRPWRSGMQRVGKGFNASQTSHYMRQSLWERTVEEGSISNAWMMLQWHGRSMSDETDDFKRLLLISNAFKPTLLTVSVLLGSNSSLWIRVSALLPHSWPWIDHHHHGSRLMRSSSSLTVGKSVHPDRVSQRLIDVLRPTR